jgi:hypothetical protein
MERAAQADTQQKYTRVNREKLITQLKKNREHHKEAFNMSLKGWRDQYAESLKEYAEQLKGHTQECEAREMDIRGAETPEDIGKIEDLELLSHFRFPPRPSSHVSEYTEIIARMGMSLDEDIFLTHRDFRCYILDKWDWTGEFVAIASNYAPPGVFTRTLFEEPE